MVKRMLIDATHREETRVVVLDGTRLDEFDVETSSKKQIKSNIYLAKVVRVEPSLQAAFVDYGGNRHGFLAFSEIHPDYYQIPVADREKLLAEVRRQRERDEAHAIESIDDPVSAPASHADAGQERGGVSEIVDHDLPDSMVAPEQAPGDTASLDATQPSVSSAPIEADDEIPGDDDSPLPPIGDGSFPDLSAHQTDDESDQHEPGHHEAVETAHDPDEPNDAETGGPGIDHDPIDGGVPQTHGGQTDAAGDTAEATEFSTDGSTPPEAFPDTSETAESPIAASPDGPAEAVMEPVSVDVVGGEDEPEVEENDRQRQRFVSQRHYKIQEVIKRRQIMLVQVVKEERGNKGAALTTYLSLAGRYCVLMPNSSRGGGVSRKITSAADRRRLKSILGELETPSSMAVILRTAGSERSKAEIKRDYEYLMRTWDNIRDVTMQSRAPALIHEEASLIKRAIRDVYSRDIEEVLVEGEDGYKIAKDFMKMLTPSHAKRVQRYKDDVIPLFQRYQVESQLEAMNTPMVQLRSGGSIVFGQTEALVAIDVNSGRATRERHIEETALKTNLEAADEIARQLRLRDLAGLVVIDFIDMEENRNNHAVERRLKEALKNDRARIQVGRISHFGLLELSRQRLRPSLIETNYRPCPHCSGTGHVRSTESAAIYALRMIEEEGVRRRSSELTVTVHPSVALYILNHKRAAIADMESRFALRIFILGDDNLVAPALRIDRVKMTRAAAEEVAGTPPPRAIAPVEVEADAEDDESEDQDEESDAVPADDEEGRAASRSESAEGEHGENGSRRRKRRRRRRRRDGHPGDEYQQHGNRNADVPVDALNEGVNVGENIEQADSGETPAESEGQHGSEQNENRDDRGRRRRRGRRGGRRRRRDGNDDRGGDRVFGATGDDAPAADMGPFTSNDLQADSSFSAQPIDITANAPMSLSAQDQAVAQSAVEPERGGASRLFRAIRDTAFSWTRPDTPKSDVVPLPPQASPEPDAMTVEVSRPAETPPPIPAAPPLASEAPEPPAGPPRRGWWQQSS